MGLYEHFPYTNLQNLNLDWILEVVKDFKLKFESAEQWLADAIAAMSAAKDADIAEMAAELQTLLDQMQAQYDELIDGFQQAYQTWINVWADSAGRIQQECQANIEATGEQTLNSIPEDYTTFYRTAMRQGGLYPSMYSNFNDPHFLIGGAVDYFSNIGDFTNIPTGAAGSGMCINTVRPAISPAVQATSNMLILDNGHMYIRYCSVDGQANYTYGSWVTIV